MGDLYERLTLHHREIDSARDLIALSDDELRNYVVNTVNGQLDRSDILLLTAEEEGNVIGFVRVVERVQTGFSRPHAYMDPLIVDDTYRGKGIGTILFRKGVEWARSNGFNSVWLDVWEENDRAAKLYEREGFQYVSRTMAMRLK